MNAVIKIILPSLLFFLSCSKSPDYANHRTSYFRNLHEQNFPDTTLVCATFNIQLGFPATKDAWNNAVTGADSLQIERISAMIEKVDADIVALQEVPRNRCNAVVKDFDEQLAARLEMNYAFGAHGYNDPTGIYTVHGGWGNTIFAKYKILGIENVEVSHADQWQKRSILGARLKVNDSFSLNAISLHYGNGLGEMNDGITNTQAYFRQHNGPVLLMGDSNYQFEWDKYYPEFIDVEPADADSAYLTGIDRILFTKLSFQCLRLTADTIRFLILLTTR